MFSTGRKNTKVLLGEVVDIDVEQREVDSQGSARAYPYDTVVFATGSTHSYFGHPEWEKLAPGLKTIEDATEIRSRLLLAFERAEKETDAGETAGRTYVRDRWRGARPAWNWRAPSQRFRGTR